LHHVELVLDSHESAQLFVHESLKHPRLDDFFAVSDFIIDNDPAVLSLLSGKEINVALTLTTARTCFINT